MLEISYFVTVCIYSLILNTVENIVTKGEIAHNEQFLLLPPYFQNSSAAETLEIVYSICWKYLTL